MRSGCGAPRDRAVSVCWQLPRRAGAPWVASAASSSSSAVVSARGGRGVWGGPLSLPHYPTPQELRCEELLGSWVRPRVGSGGLEAAGGCAGASPPARAPRRGPQRVCGFISAALPGSSRRGHPRTHLPRVFLWTRCPAVASLLIPHQPRCSSHLSPAFSASCSPCCPVASLSSHFAAIACPSQPLILPLISLHYTTDRIPTLLFLLPYSKPSFSSPLHVSWEVVSSFPAACRDDRCELSTYRFLAHSCRTPGGQGKAN